MINPEIPLQVQTPQQPQNALAGLAQIAQIKSASLQNALVTQEIQQRATAAQQAQYQQGAMLATNKAIQSSVDPTTGLPDYNKASATLAAAGYGDHAMALQKGAAQLQQETGKAYQEQIASEKSVAERVGNIMQSATSPQEWTTAKAYVASLPGPYQKAAALIPDDFGQKNAFVSRVSGYQAMLDQAKTKLTNQKTEAEIPGAQAESDIKVTQANAIKNFNPVQMQQQINQQVDSELNPANYPDPTIQRQVRIENANAKTSALQAARDAVAAGKPPGAAAQAAIKDSVDRVGRTYQGVATAAATVPSKVTVLQAGNNIQQQAKAKQEYAESLNNVQDIQSTAQTIKNLVEQAKAGNSTASGQLKTMLAEMTNSVQGIKRLAGGQTEQSLGSAADRLQGFIADIGSGQKVPDRVLQELPGVIDTLAATSTRAHNAHVDTTNGLYQTTFPKLPENSSTAATSGGALPQGKGQVIDTQTAQKYFDAAGGDKAKARQLAIQNGWKLQ